MQTAILSLLHARYGRPCNVITTNPQSPNIYWGNPDIDRLWLLPKRLPFFFGRAWIAIIAALRREANAPIYVQVFHPREVRGIRAILGLSGINPARCVTLDPEECGRVLSTGEPPWMDYLLQFSCRTPSAVVPRSESAPDSRNRLPLLVMNEQARAAARAVLQSKGWRGQAIVLISPGNHRTLSHRRRRKYQGSDPKCWAPENWAELFHAIRKRAPETLICLCGSPSERPLLEEIRAVSQLQPAESAVLSTTVRVFMGMCELAGSMVAVDSGLGHVAAAMGLPLVVLFGSDKREAWLPRGLGQPVIGIGGPPRSWHVNDIPVDEVCRVWESVHYAATAQRSAASTRTGSACMRSSNSHQTSNTTGSGI